MQALQSRRPSPMRRLGLLQVAVLSGLLAACDGDSAVAPRPSLSGAGNGPNGKNATVRVTPANDTLNALYDTLQLTANVAVTWTSLTPGIATVDASGHVVAVGPGLGLIEALGSRKADTAQVLVRQILASVSVTPDSITLPLQGVDTLTAIAADANGFAIADLPLIWTSDATAVATVANGVVTAVDTGTTTVRATAGGVTGTARVKVADIATPYP
jgi:hypothetical protein